MSIRVKSKDIYYKKLKDLLAKKDIKKIKLREILSDFRDDPNLFDYLLENLEYGDDVIKKNSIIMIYLILEEKEITSKEENLINKLIEKYKIKISIDELKDEA